MVVEYLDGGGGDKGDLFAKTFGASNIMEQVKNKERSRRKEEIRAGNYKAFYYGHEDENKVLEAIKLQYYTDNNIKINLTGHSGTVEKRSERRLVEAKIGEKPQFTPSK